MMSLIYLLGNLKFSSKNEESDKIYKYLKEKTSESSCRKGYYSYSDPKKKIKFVKVCK